MARHQLFNNNNISNNCYVSISNLGQEMSSVYGDALEQMFFSSAFRLQSSA